MSGLRLLVTGGAGFIGSALVRHLIAETSHDVLCLDKLTYAGNLDSLSGVESSPRYRFVRADICDAGALSKVFKRYEPDVVMHLAAARYVNRSIDFRNKYLKVSGNMYINFSNLRDVSFDRCRLRTDHDSFI